KDNTFQAMGRYGLPGAIGVDGSGSGHTLGDVQITGNQILGVSEGCTSATGVAVLAVGGAEFGDVVIANNTGRGCHQLGIVVEGWKTALEKSVTIVGNEVSDIGIASGNSFGILLTTDASGSGKPWRGVVVGNAIHGAWTGFGIAVTGSDAI